MWKNKSALSGLGKNKMNIGLTEVENDDGELLSGQQVANFRNNFYICVGPMIN